jgi:hypothetical protein
MSHWRRRLPSGDVLLITRDMDLWWPQAECHRCDARTELWRQVGPRRADTPIEDIQAALEAWAEQAGRA